MLSPLSRQPYLHLALIFFSMLPATMLVPIIKEIVKDRLDGTNTDAASFLSIALLGAFLSAPIAGYLSDRLRNRRDFIALFALIDALCFLLLAYADNLTFLFAIRFIEGASSIFVISLLFALITDYENWPGSIWHQRGLLIGLGVTCLLLGSSLGLPLAIISRYAPLLPLYVAAAIMLGVALLSYLGIKETPILQSNLSENKKKYQGLLQQPLIFLPCVYTFIDRFSVGFFVGTFNIYMRESLGFSAGQVGLALGLVLLPMALLAWPVATWVQRWGILPLLLSGSLIYGLCEFGIGYIQDSTGLFLMLALCGLGAGLMFTPSVLFAAWVAPVSLRATTMSLFFACGSLGFMLGPISFALIEKYLQNFLVKTELMPMLSSIAGGTEILLVLMTLPFYYILRRNIATAKELHKKNT